METCRAAVVLRCTRTQVLSISCRMHDCQTQVSMSAPIHCIHNKLHREQSCIPCRRPIFVSQPLNFGDRTVTQGLEVLLHMLVGAAECNTVPHRDVTNNNSSVFL